MLLLQKQHFPLIPPCFAASPEAAILHYTNLIPAFGKEGKNASSASGEAERQTKKEAEFFEFSLFFYLK